jgi:uroporphyrinogen-III synthase
VTLGEARIASIGPLTSAEARELGLGVDVEAERHDVDGLVEALLRDAAVDRLHTPTPEVS